ncbi:hypothetical protein FFLO_02879 [Filobasidium floriforme]|uniref:Phosphatidylinositol N-acetylglucosaminyltransferase subunit H conserved domain-containing protein n=1 Tax=Filobasidium floriforme TaxID=5210 RepID=A0A8K0NTP1_9TREE|nr:uncharacterized protein HD553DRAFT_306609 [Filobasidium floriforme]KAG7558226.1 hypothetical protein FFLO_02879 [Filobasidium floriforme]KAH8088503.1 hypothetical protein HD553DRAFT_306609 [Filobasidium floriforme]
MVMAMHRNSSNSGDLTKNGDDRNFKKNLTAECSLPGISHGNDAQSSQEQRTESVSFPLPGHPQLSSKRTWPVGGDADHPLCVEYCYIPTVKVGLFHWILWGSFWMGLACILKVYGSNVFKLHRWTTACCICLLLIANKSVVSESAVAFPNLGIQLESTTAIIIPFPFSLRLVVPLGTSKRFIPLSNIRSSSRIFLNEAFHRWSVVYYLGVLSRGGMYECAGGYGVEGLEVHVVFPTTRPRLEVLLEVYHGLRETLYDDFNDLDDNDDDER